MKVNNINIPVQYIDSGCNGNYLMYLNGNLKNIKTGRLLKLNKDNTYNIYNSKSKKTNKLSLKTLYRLVYNKEFCIDNTDIIIGEVWKYINNVYLISNFGNVKSYKGYHAIILSPNYINGYAIVKLNIDGIEKNYKIHRLVAEYFIPNPLNKQYVHHKDCNRNNNNVNNLQWVSQKEHIQIHRKVVDNG